MSTDDRLSPELSQIENDLRQLPLGPTRVDRDATLFGAGWAAAEANRTNRLKVWQAASGVLAASVAVLALTLIDHKPPTALSVAASQRDAKPEQPLDWTPAPRIRAAQGTPLYERELALRGVFPEPPDFDFNNNDDEDFSMGKVKSARELLKEFLPPRRRES